MHTLRVVFVVALAVTVVGCGKKRVAPAGEQKLSLAGKQATFHEWGKVTPCDVEPKKLAGDLDSSAALLGDYLGQTSAGADGVWTPEQEALLLDGAKTLEPLLAATEKAVAGAAKCKFEKKDALADPLHKAGELVAQARRRISDTPALVAALKAKADLKEWKDKQPEARANAKKEWCPAKLKAGAVPDIYFASEDDTGQTEWLFCDDCRVFAAPEKPPAFEAPAAMKKKPKDKGYLESAAKYPASDIQHPPKAAPPATKESAPKDAADEPKM